MGRIRGENYTFYQVGQEQMKTGSHRLRGDI